jgi:hypothetical protein
MSLRIAESSLGRKRAPAEKCHRMSFDPPVASTANTAQPKDKAEHLIQIKI